MYGSSTHGMQALIKYGKPTRPYHPKQPFLSSLLLPPALLTRPPLRITCSSFGVQLQTVKYSQRTTSTRDISVCVYCCRMARVVAPTRRRSILRTSSTASSDTRRLHHVCTYLRQGSITARWSSSRAASGCLLLKLLIGCRLRRCPACRQRQRALLSVSRPRARSMPFQIQVMFSIK